jgi:hypothetical protein
MVTGVKISELASLTNLDNAFVPVIKGGVNYKTLASFFTNLVSGIGQETEVLSSSDGYDIDTFGVGDIVSISDTETNAVAAGAPASGLSGASNVFWSIFTFGTDTMKTQLAFSPQVDIEKFFIRFGEIGSAAVWSEWSLLSQNASNFPTLKLNSQTMVTPIIVTSTAIYYDVRCSAVRTFVEPECRYFEDLGDGTAKYICPIPSIMEFTDDICGYMSTGGYFVYYQHERNGYIQGDPTQIVQDEQTIMTVSSTMFMQYGDIISLKYRNVSNTLNLTLYGLQRYGNFKGWAIEDDYLGAELFENPDITSTDGFTATSCTLSVNSDGELLAVATGLPAYVDIDINAITSAVRCRVSVTGKRGSQGSFQTFDSIDFVSNTIDPENFSTTSEETIVRDGLTYTTSGIVRLQVASISGAINDELIVTAVSVKEYL